MNRHRPTRPLSVLEVSGGLARPGMRSVPEETAVALTYNRCAHAVMMATPADLEDFAVGFSLSEGIVNAAREIRALDIVPSDLGVEARMTIDEARMDAWSDRRRLLAGPTGCGLCGMESLDAAMRPAPAVSAALSLPAAAISAAIAAMPEWQAMNRETRAVHAAAFWTEGLGIVALREDVGRHNALDKLAGALARGPHDDRRGVVLLTSRVSVEMVQKTASLGAPILAAISAPTALAVRTAEAAGVTLVAIARGADFSVFTHPDRITGLSTRHVA